MLTPLQFFKKVQAASRISNGKARLALSLVGYDNEVSNAMAYVFGDTMICDDAASAKLVTFSRELGGVRSVTLDGDVYDPSGTLSGGSAPSSSGVLVKVQDLQRAEQRLREATEVLQRLETDATKNAQVREKWRQMTSALELKHHEVTLMQQQVEGSNASRVRGVCIP